MGINSKNPPVMYVIDDPTPQNALNGREINLLITLFNHSERALKLPIDATMGPIALAKAPSDRNIPNTVPF